jgi:hypothetical protein
MFSFDQIAVRVEDMDLAIAEMNKQSHIDWIRDEVQAVHLFRHPAFQLGDKFEVKLAFNYELFQGVEFELIQLVSGKTAQLLEKQCGVTSISHFGYHVANQESSVQDTLVTELKRLQDDGVSIVQVSETIRHTKTSKRYRYAFGFWPTVGAPVKIIQRLAPGESPDTSAAKGRELFQWLS